MKNRKIYLPFTDTFDPFRDSAESEGYPYTSISP